MKGWVAFELPENERANLLGLFDARYPDVICHHITHAFGVGDDYELPRQTAGQVIGIADDGDGVQALVVDMGEDRPDGGTYHITFSIDKAAGRSAKQSNDVIRECGFLPVPRVPLKGLVARFYPFSRPS
jgi:hypothetical protein